MKSDAVNAGHLRAFVERVERLEEEKRALGDDIKDVYAEAKGNGFDIKTLRKIVSLRRQDSDKRREAEEILDLYLSALGIDREMRDLAGADRTRFARLANEARRLLLPGEMGERFKVMAWLKGAELALHGFALKDLRHSL